ncbi:MAG TPA: hypothetical protein VLA17_12705 [Candidatus Limnocylindria bacterium]|nr:hypothetical protein [Candidatus Limnocylindria bacterium]
MKPLILAHKCALIILSLCLVASVSTVHGHEFILKPAKFQAQTGGKIPFGVVAAHVFMLSNAMEPIDTVKAWLHQGAKLSFRILLDGKPLTTMVYATYDGFSRHDYTYAYATESKGGTAHITFSHPGVSMVRVENRRQKDHKDFNQQVLKATLILAVQ